MADSWREKIERWWTGSTAVERHGEPLTAALEKEMDAVDQETVRIKDELQEMIYAVRERAWVIQETGLVLGEGKERLYTDPMGFEAPKHHPVWADELRYELEKLREMGEAGTVKKREYEWDLVKWPRANVLERLGERVKDRHTEAAHNEEEHDHGRDR